MAASALPSNIASLDGEFPLPATLHYVGRQPIFNGNQQVSAYELLFRSGLQNCFTGDPDQATRHVIDNVLLFGLDTLTPGVKAFVNCTRASLIERLVTSLPAKLTVLEIDAMEVDEPVLEACTELKRLGYNIAIDHLLPSQCATPMAALADYIKLDFRSGYAADLSDIRRALRDSSVQFVAQKVETEVEFKKAKSIGYDLFQGYFFARPSVLQRREIPSSQAIHVQLLRAISQERYDDREVERLVMAEASLCFRILRLANSPMLAVRSEISSIRQALLLIGQDEFRKLVTIASATHLGKRMGMSSELILLALHRARFCELLAPIVGLPPGEQYLIGLLSVFDAILQIPTTQILELLPLRPEAAAVLLGQDTPAAVPFRLLQSYELRQWVRCARVCHNLHISEFELTSFYLKALQWASKEIRDAGL